MWVLSTSSVRLPVPPPRGGSTPLFPVSSFTTTVLCRLLCDVRNLPSLIGSDDGPYRITSVLTRLDP